MDSAVFVFVYLVCSYLIGYLIFYSLTRKKLAASIFAVVGTLSGEFVGTILKSQLVCITEWVAFLVLMVLYLKYLKHRRNKKVKK